MHAAKWRVTSQFRKQSSIFIGLGHGFQLLSRMRTADVPDCNILHARTDAHAMWSQSCIAQTDTHANRITGHHTQELEYTKRRSRCCVVDVSIQQLGCYRDDITINRNSYRNGLLVPRASLVVTEYKIQEDLDRNIHLPIVLWFQ